MSSCSIATSLPAHPNARAHRLRHAAAYRGVATLRRPRETPIWQLEQRMRCKPCSEQRGYPFKRGYLVRLRRSKLTTKDDGEPWYPGDQRERN
jgi:hypothetical protein